VQRLQALAGDVDNYPLAGTDLPALGQLGEDADRDPAGGLGEDPRRLRQQADAGADLLVGDRVDRATAAPRLLERVGAVGGTAGRQALGDRLRLLWLADVPAFGKGGRHRAAAERLGAVEDRLLAFDQAQVGPLLEAAGDLGEERAGGDRADHPVGKLPAELL